MNVLGRPESFFRQRGFYERRGRGGGFSLAQTSPSGGATFAFKVSTRREKEKKKEDIVSDKKTRRVSVVVAWATYRPRLGQQQRRWHSPTASTVPAPMCIRAVDVRREPRWGDLLTQFVENMTQPRLTPSHYTYLSPSLSQPVLLPLVRSSSFLALLPPSPPPLCLPLLLTSLRSLTLSLHFPLALHRRSVSSYSQTLSLHPRVPSSSPDVRASFSCFYLPSPFSSLHLLSSLSYLGTSRKAVTARMRLSLSDPSSVVPLTLIHAHSHFLSSSHTSSPPPPPAHLFSLSSTLSLSFPYIHD